MAFQMDGLFPNLKVSAMQSKCYFIAENRLGLMVEEDLGD